MNGPERIRVPALLLAFVAVVLLPAGNLEAAQSAARPLPGWAGPFPSALVGEKVPATALELGAAVALAVKEQGQEQVEEEGEKEAEFRNELALIIAGTYEDPDNFFTIGAKYQREITSVIAVAGVFEYLNTKPAALLVFPVHFRVWEGIDLFAGPGVEFAEEEEEDGEDHDDGEEGGDSDAWDATFLIRVGVGYAIELGERYSFSPSVAVDFIGRERAFVYGADFSIKF